VRFDSPRHGTVSLGNNGPSGSGLLTDILTPMGIDAANVAFTDAVPWFFVKSGKDSQGAAITERFNAVAGQLGLVEGSLPDRPTPKALVEIATSEQRRDGLRREISDAGAPLVITLGQEALDATRRIADRCEGVQTRLTPQGYGTKGVLEIDGATVAFLPLAHPGFLRQTVDSKWTQAIGAWRQSLGNSPSTDATVKPKCLVIGHNETLHLLDETRSTDSQKWSKCSQTSHDGWRVLALANARDQLPHHVPCQECFPGRTLPEHHSA